MRKLLTVLILGLGLLLMPNLAWAQEGTITGRITDESNGSRLPGATVQVQNTEMGTVSDSEGNYTLSGVPAGEQTLLVSYVGFEDEERTVNVPAGGTVRVNFQLSPGTAQLQEVTVTGYRTERTTVETGATGNIDANQLESADINSADQALQGEIAGVRVTSGSGQPGSAIQVRIRGQGSITAGNNPLFIIDGVQVSTSSTFSLASGNPLANLNPSDIANIEVLRGAAAASIYGAQASNGVVIISTKSGRAGDTQINFSSTIGRTQRLKKFDMSTLEEWSDFVGHANEYALNQLFGADFFTPETARQVSFSNLDCPLQAVPAALQGPLQGLCNTSFAAGGVHLGSTADSLRTDWPDAVYRKAYTQEYDLSVRGGDQNTRFFVSGRFSFDQGQVLDSKLRSGGLRVNVEQDAKEWLTASANLDVSTLNVTGTISNGPFINSPFWASYLIPSNAPIYQRPGDPSSGYNLTPNFVFTYNPVAQEDFNTRTSNNTQINGSTSLNWNFGSGWQARTLAGIQFQDTFENDYNDPRLPANADVSGSQQVFNDREVNYNVSQTLTYDNVFAGSHSISGLLGAEFKKEEVLGVFTDGQGFPNNLFRTLQSAANPIGVSYSETQYRQLSFFTDLKYTYEQKYQLRGTLRFDGNSRFGQENRFGTFGSISAYWRLSETLLSGVDFLTDLKLRASYGEVGNNEIGNFQARRLFSSGGEYSGVAGINPSSLGNTGLTWEEKKEVNVGLDYALFGGRVSGSLDAYRNITDRLLLNRDLPGDSGFGSFIDNVGKLRNLGFEAQLETTNIDRAFQWQTSFNIAFQDTEVRELLPDDDEINAGGFVYRVGHPPAQYELTPFAGVNPANGVSMYTDRNGNLTYDPTDTEDQRLVGNTNADFYGGFTNRFSFKGLTAEVFFQYDYGRETFNNDAYFLEANTFYYLNRSDEALDYWREPGDITDTPKPTGFSDTFGPFAANGFGSTRWYENASYIRLKRVRVSYSMPSSVLSQIPQVGAINLFVQARNLATWTNFTGFDPEVIGTSLGEYPQGKTFSAGLNVTL